MDDWALREELAALLRDNSDAISARLEKKFVEEYPSAAANDMAADRIHRWTLAEVETMARAIESGDANLAVRQGNFGQLVEERDPDVSQLASVLATVLFMARHIAPLIFLFTDINNNDGKSQKMIALFEGFIRELMIRYCDKFVAEIDRPGALAKKWDILSGLDLDVEPEVTPMKKHRKVEVPSGWHELPIEKSVWESGFLTSREKDVLKQLVSGRSNCEIAEALGIRQSTVKNHVARIFGKFGVSSRAELIAEVLGEKHDSAEG